MNKAFALFTAFVMCAVAAFGQSWGLNFDEDVAGATSRTGWARQSAIIGLWDCLQSAGTNLRASNTSANSNRWVDLSGHGHDIMLVDFDFSSASGWDASGALLFDGSNMATGTLVDASSAVTVLVIGSTGAESFQYYFNHSPDVNIFAGGLLIDWQQFGTGKVGVGLRTSDSYSIRTSSTALFGRGDIIASTLTVSPDTTMSLCRGYVGAVELDTAGYGWDSRTVTQIYKGVFTVGDLLARSFNGMKGKVYLIAVWNVALSTDEIAENLSYAKRRYGF